MSNIKPLIIATNSINSKRLPQRVIMTPLSVHAYVVSQTNNAHGISDWVL